VNERVLLVEDDPSIREVVALGLRQSGFRVDSAADGGEGLVQFRQKTYDVLLLDVMLPTMDGFEVCRQVRAGSRVPIVMLTARTSTVDVVVGLELGADDYVTKPFELPELVARVRAVLRRSTAEPEQRPISVGDLEIDPSAFRARRGEIDLALTTTEFRLLFELAVHRGQVLTRDQLLDRVWGTPTWETRGWWTWPFNASARRWAATPSTPCAASDTGSRDRYTPVTPR
jgi:two-component system, OmpR family, response regulator MtrA